jgi:tRNA nucleotidyltransferase (CCA-adding enzyme)
LAALTADRLRHEFEFIFREPRASAMLERLLSLDILRHVHSALRWDADATRRASSIHALPIADWRLPAPPEPDALYLTLLLAKAGESEIGEALTRLNINRAVFEAVQSALALRVNWTRPSEVVAVLDKLDELAVIAAYVLRGAPDLSAYLARWRFVRATTTGDDLIARGLPPGPDFKRILWTLRAARLDGQVTTDDEERALLDRVLAQ